MPSHRFLLPVSLIVLAVALALLQREPHPDIDAQLPLQRIDGVKQRFADFRGKPLLVTFWSPSCTICLREVVELNRLYHEKQGGQAFELLGVSMVYDRPDHVLETSRQADMRYPVYLDLNNEIGTAFGNVRVTPTSFLVDNKGRIVLKFVGKPDIQLIEESLAKLMV